MGSTTSHPESPGGELRLPRAGLRFTPAQLHALNGYVDTLHQQDQDGRMTPEQESELETLVQRIVDGAGQRDPRFRCCHLIALHREKKVRSRSLEYLVTLDALPPPDAGPDCRLQDAPPGLGRLRLSGALADTWAEFLSPNGYLCRDKLVERWVQLLARCAHARGGGGARVLSASAADRARPYQYCYLERVSPPPPSPHRLALVEGAAWVMLRAGGEAKLQLSARAGRGGPPAPLGHPLALLQYSAARMTSYLVAVGPPAGCPERAGTWQRWSPAAEAALDAHCTSGSTPAVVAGAVSGLVQRMRDGAAQGSLQVTSRYMASCAVRRRWLRAGGLDSAVARAVCAPHRAHHFLMIVDDLISSQLGLQAGAGRAARRGARAGPGDWAADAACLRALLGHLHADSGNAEIPKPLPECVELVLLRRWEALAREARAAAAPPRCSRRQLRYLWRLARELLDCRAYGAPATHSTFKANLLQATYQQDPREDLIHILAIMLDQARDLYLQNNLTNPPLSHLQRHDSVYRSKKWNKLKNYYDASSACLIDAIRRDPELREEDLTDGLNMMQQILNWLYKGAKDDKKYLGPVLKGYLEGLYMSSLENCWFLEDFDAKRSVKEYEGLVDFCTGVHNGKVEPRDALVELSKKMSWAKALVDFVERSKHSEFRLVFPTGDGMAVSYPMPPAPRARAALTLSRRDKEEAKLKLARRCVLAAFEAAIVGEDSPPDLPRYSSAEEILSSVKAGQFWRSAVKPDVVASSLELSAAGLARRARPDSSYGFPEISIAARADAKTLRRRYHTLKSLVYSEPESVRSLRQRPRSAGSSLRCAETMSRPTILETLDFITGVKDTLCVEDSNTSDLEESWSSTDDWALARSQPLAVLARGGGGGGGGHLHLLLGDIVVALLQRGKFSVLQEVGGQVGAGALLALHRLARATRCRSSERSTDWQLPLPADPSPPRYRPRRTGSDDDESPPAPPAPPRPPPPPPLPRISSRKLVTDTRYADYQPPSRMQQLESDLRHLQLVNERLDVKQPPPRAAPPPAPPPAPPRATPCTGVLRPSYDESKIPKKKFSTKRSKSLGRSFASSKAGPELPRYNLTAGRRRRTNDVITAIAGGDGRRDGIAPEAYRLCRVNID